LALDEDVKVLSMSQERDWWSFTSDLVEVSLVSSFLHQKANFSIKDAMGLNAGALAGAEARVGAGAKA
jgi:hypothetical protein